MIKVGDKVRVKTWTQIARENDSGTDVDIKMKGYGWFTLDMRKFCGTETTVKAVMGEILDLEGINYVITVDMVEPVSKEDVVNHPSHYANSCSLECFDVMKLVFGEDAVRHYCLCNAFKYLWRHKHKNGMEDLKKAGWYLSKVDSQDAEYLKEMVKKAKENWKE